MSLSAGDKLGPYEIVAPIGAGGMGEVYRARDSRLKREVALKVLPEAFARDPERMARFQREAEVLASLNHPNIAAIYGIEDRALVMELVEGGAPVGPMPFDEAWKIASQIAGALEYAHDKGIVHRDLKPANIRVTPDGVVKLLDFGLAKAFSAQKDSASPNAGTSPEHSPTLTIGATGAGMILGTAAYMSPEQARGRPVDKRADIWAFGVVVYELLAGAQLHQRDTVSDTLAAVLREEPNWEKVPVRFRTMLRRCLEKDPKNRLRDIGDAMPLVEQSPVEKSHAEARRGSRTAWAAAAVFGCAAVVLAAIHFREKPVAPPAVTRFQIHLPAGVRFGDSGSLALSPDGRHLAFSAVDITALPRVWVQEMDALEARPLMATSTGPIVPPFFWSPDSRFIVYSENSSKLKKADIQNGAVQEICDKPAPPVGGSWSVDGMIIFGGTNTGLWKVPASGGKPSPLTALDPSKNERSHQLPVFLPDGRHFLYLRSSTNPDEGGIFAGSLDDPPERQSRKRILATALGAHFVSPNTSHSGWLLFQRESTLMAQRFDADKLDLNGDPAVLAEGVGSIFQTGLFSGAGNALVYRTSASGRNVQMTWLDKQGKQVGKAGEPGNILYPRISPDGARVAYQKVMTADESNSDVWLLDLKKDTSTRFTFGPGPAGSPVWSPDGSEIVFSFRKEKFSDLYRKPTDGGREEEALLKSKEHKRPWSWSQDGRFLLYGTSQNEGFIGEDLWVLPLGGNRAPFPFLATDFQESEAAFSPDGRWVAYTSNESGRSQLYVREFQDSPGSARAGGKWMVSKEDGRFPAWKADGADLMYLSIRSPARAPSSPAAVLSVAVEKAHTFQSGATRELFQAPMVAYIAAAPDFQRFLARVPVEDKTSQAFTVVLNWTSLLKAR